MTESNQRVRITVLLDDETLKTLRDYSYQENGTTNVSKAIMSMVKKNEKSKEYSGENVREKA